MQDAIPHEAAGHAWLNGTTIYSTGPVPSSFLEHANGLLPEYVTHFLCPPTALPIVGLLAAIGPVALILQIGGILCFARAAALFYMRNQNLRSVGLLACCLPQVYICIEKAQTAPVLAWAFAALFFGHRRGELAAALALAACFKAWPMVLIGALLMAPDQRERWVEGVGALALLALLSVIAGPEAWGHYLRWLPSFQPEHTFNAAPVAWVGTLPGLAFVPVLLYGAWREAATDWLLALLILGVITWTSPLLWMYYAPAWLLVVYAVADSRLSWALGLGAVAISWVPAAWAGAAGAVWFGATTFSITTRRARAIH